MSVVKNKISPAMVVLFVGVFASIIFFLTRDTAVVSDTTDTLLVGISPDFPPFASMQNDEPVGLDVDLAYEIAKRLDKKLVLKSMQFVTLIPSLQLGSLDVVAAGLTTTPERAQQVLFTTSYKDENPLVIVSAHASPAKTVDDLQGKEVVVTQGHTADLHMSKIEGVMVQRLKSVADAFFALKSGRAYAFVVAEDSVKPFFAQYGEKEFNLAPIPGTSENAALAVTMKKPELHKQIQKALDAMKDDGTLETLRQKWGL